MRGSARRIAVQGPLGFASGLPRPLTAGTLTAWLTTADVSYEAIGAFALVSLVYNAKILWAPVLDRFRLPWLDRRRGWILLSQLLLAVAIFVMGTIDPRASVAGMALAAVAVAFLSASQDIVVDAYRTDLLPDGERGKGTAGYVTGYRVASLLAGFGALIAADAIGWRNTYWILSVLMLLGVGATLWAPALPKAKPPRSLRDALYEPLKEFFKRRGAVIALAFILLYKVGDAVAGHWVSPFLLKELRFSLTEVGTLQKFLGFGATVAGAAIGGYYVDRIGVRKSLFIFGFAQAFANAGYMLLAYTGKSYPTLIFAIGTDNACNGMGTSAFVAFLMALCHVKYSATQYALFTGVMSLLGNALNAGAGFMIGPLGWSAFFGATIVLAMPALALVRWLPEGAPRDDDDDDDDDDPGSS